MTPRFHRSALAAAALIAVASMAHAQTPAPAASPAAASSVPQSFSLNLPAQPLRTALEAFAAQTGMQVVYGSSDVAASGQSNAVVGSYPAEEALQRMLAGTGVAHSFVNANTVRIASGAAAAAGDQTAQRVEIVGTNLGRRDKATPVTVITADDIQRDGYASVEDVFRRLPQSFSSMTSLSQALGEREYGDKYGNPSSVGSSSVNLRGLGSNATLVLINGRRKIGSSQAGGSFVDISSIPLSQIERIEVLTDGASAIYGADAVGGVVNIVLKKNYDGPTVNARTEFSSTGGDQHRLSLANTFRWDSGELSANVSTSRTLPVNLWDRIASGPTGKGDYTLLGGVNQRLPGIGTPGVVYDVMVMQLGPNFFRYIHGAAKGQIPTGQDGSNVRPRDILPLDPTKPFEPSYFPEFSKGPLVQHNGLNLSMEQQLGGDHAFKADLSYSLQRDGERWHPSMGEMSFLVGGMGNPTDPLDNARCVYVPTTNPANKLRKDVCVGYSFDKESQLLTLSNNQRLTNLNATVGFSGPIAGSWTYDVSLTHSQERSQTEGLNGVRSLSDPANQSSAALVRAAMDKLNVFSDGQNAEVIANNAAVLSTLMKTNAMRGSASGTTLDAVARGTLATWDAGDIRAAMGVQLRRESQERTMQDISVDIEGSRRVGAVFTEVGIPLLRDAPAAKELALTLAGRYERIAMDGRGGVYNTAGIYDPVTFQPIGSMTDAGGFDMASQLGAPWIAGAAGVGDQPAYARDRTFSNFSPLMRLTWVPVDGFRLRSTLGRSFLAPDARQLLGLTEVGDYYYIVGANATLPPGVTTVIGITGANPKLKPQTAQTFTLGTDITPPEVPGLKLSATYNHTVFNNYITELLEGGISYQALIDGRDQLAPGTIQINNGVMLMDLRQQNANRRVSRSVDLDAYYPFDTDFGSWSIGIRATRTLELSSRATQFSQPFEFSDTEFGPSKWKGSATLTWGLSDYSAALTVNHSSAHRVLRPAGLQPGPDGNPLLANPLYTSAGYTTFDAQFAWQPQDEGSWTQGLKLAIGAQNLFDAKFPFVDNYFGFVSSRVNPRGRVVYLELTKQF